MKKGTSLLVVASLLIVSTLGCKAFIGWWILSKNLLTSMDILLLDSDLG